MAKIRTTKKFRQTIDLEDLLYMIHEDLQVLCGAGGKFTSIRRVTATNITSIDGAVLDSLKCGDQVAKITGNQQHLYTVSYKGEGSGEGICLTYVAAGLIETVSYDRTDSGWVYNSTDMCTISVD